MSSSSTRPSSDRQPPAHTRRLSSSTVRASVLQRTTSSASTCPEGRVRQRGDRLRELTGPRLLHIKGSAPFGGDAGLAPGRRGAGAGRGCRGRGRAAQARGFEVDVLAIDPYFQASIRNAGLGLVDLDVIRREIRPVWDARGLTRRTRVLSRSEYSIVHTHTTKPGVVGTLAARLGGVPSVVHTVHL